jgi:hypothetical protein
LSSGLLTLWWAIAVMPDVVAAKQGVATAPRKAPAMTVAMIGLVIRTVMLLMVLAPLSWH